MEMIRIVIPAVCFLMIALGIFLIGWSIYRYVMNKLDE